VRTAELTDKSTANPATGAIPPTDRTDPDLIAAIAGKQAVRESAVAERTRRVVMASLGVMRNQKSDRRRARSIALAGVVVVLLVFGPLLWRIAEDLLTEDFTSDIALQSSFWASLLCVATLAAVLVAGWSQRNKR
jgi:hypothetical protein